MSVIMKVEGISKSFGGLRAVNALSMDILEHKVNALIGPNGAGKTTTINLLTGVIVPDEGSIHLKNQDITGFHEYQVARCGVRRTFQNLKLFGRMTTLENVMVGAQGQSTSMLRYVVDPVWSGKMEKQLHEQALEAISYVGLSEYTDKIVKDLPYGVQKRIEIARALVAKPDVLLLDEPAKGLNPTERADLVRLMNKICADKITILIIEHNMDVIMNTSDWITVLNFGTKIAEGTPSEIQNNDLVIEAYLGSRFKKTTE